MKYSYDNNGTSVLIIHANESDRYNLAELPNRSVNCEHEALEVLICNSDLEWIDPSETGDLTDAPMLGIRDHKGRIFHHWAYMDYQVRSFIDDLIETGRAIFIC